MLFRSPQNPKTPKPQNPLNMKMNNNINLFELRLFLGVIRLLFNCIYRLGENKIDNYLIFIKQT